MNFFAEPMNAWCIRQPYFLLLTTYPDNGNHQEIPAMILYKIGPLSLMSMKKVKSKEEEIGGTM